MKFPSLRGAPGPFMAFGILYLAVTSQILTGCESSPEDPPVDPDAQIVILNPLGGETFRIGQVVPIRWKTQGKGDEDVNGVSLELSPDDGAEWIFIVNRSIGVGDEDWGDFAWTVPEKVSRLGRDYPLAGNRTLRIRIKQYSSSDTDQIAVLAKPFAAAAP